MNTREAAELISGAIAGHSGTWADLGAGDGTFTHALVERLGAESRVYAVDRDPRAIATLRRWARSSAASVIPVGADFTEPFELPGLDGEGLDGMLFANSLHYVSDAQVVLARLIRWLRPDGRAVFVEYDQRRATRWVPYPLPPTRLAEVVRGAGLSAPVVTATRPSAFGGELYVAVAELRGV
jgi:ubiquinone/menaquinone biosynthesis C-methylase UbiE